ncbi:MAG: PorP/SprF family type IX secretion system membrane protein [Prevotellaceae bacterium]|jgi:type IX secretion system PorP/SprF family membrane protein|nr:PorP/SprF family type IX secretion system membrane protein [Prevotellaceae bacterium]
MQGIVIKKWLLGIVILSCSVKVFAQQDMQYTQYLFNYLVVNPAYAGYKEATNLQAFSRMQWMGVNGAPNIYSISVDGTAMGGDVVGWGGQLVNEQMGAHNLVSLFGTYAFRLRLNQRDDRLSFGLSAGVTQWQLNYNKLQPGKEMDLTYFAENYTRPEWRPDFRIGAYYNTPFFYAGVSATNLFANFSGDIRIPHLYVSAGGFISINNSFGLKPSFIYRNDFKGPGNIDINLLALLMKQLWVGINYRTGIYIGPIKASEVETIQTTNTLAFMIELFVVKNMQIGYSYDLSVMGTGWPGSHEISLSYTIPKKKTRQSTPRYF